MFNNRIPVEAVGNRSLVLAAGSRIHCSRIPAWAVGNRNPAWVVGNRILAQSSKSAPNFAPFFQI